MQHEDSSVLPSDLDGSRDTIEMSNMPVDEYRASSDDDFEQDIMKARMFSPEPHDFDEDEFDGTEEGSRALLGGHERVVDRQRSPSSGENVSLWTQIKHIVIETTPTLLFTTMGLLFTGRILEDVSHWRAMARIDELIMIIPVILNLKGNLEMNLSARLGTAANVGELDKPGARRQIILGNLTLLQVQATVVSFVAACVAFVLGRVIPRPPGEGAVEALPGNSTSIARQRDAISSLSFSSHDRRRPRPTIPSGQPTSGLAEFVMVASSAMTSACFSSILLGSFMCGLVVLCRRWGLDPDNIAPPIAACLGDLVTVSVLGLFSSLHLLIIDTPIPLIIVITLVCAAVGWTIVTRRNEYVSHLLLEGWSPLFAAMAVSSGAGIVLDTFVSRYEGYALLSVVIAGLPGGVGSIFVSRLSTALHAASLTMLPSTSTGDPVSAEKTHQPAPRLVLVTLLLVSLPIEIIFLAIVHAFGWLELPFVFMFLQVIFFCLTIVTSLYLAQILTNVLWKRNLDPDMYALPVHSALVDLVGQLLLVACYEVASLLGAQVRNTRSS